ncbi:MULTISPECIES: hypothetical protein [Methylobacterium]|uniref:hypothetical protein n=1 Tax=Methylobacterium TaxID=407 RepID=UPI0011C7D260|nr:MULTISPECIES: hypothetical protein [unclassified Methylobacterium]TXN40021.1 hypothetical protein FV233_27255 [Methylobacterium sp. WL7]TXN75750.1 hypothetical protein FV228_02890 [Methylobacterium sp. WL18]
MPATPPRLPFSHAGQDFVVKARPVADGVEVRGFWHARSRGRTRFSVVVPADAIQKAQRPDWADPVQAALKLVRNQIISAINEGEPLAEEAQL